MGVEKEFEAYVEKWHVIGSKGKDDRRDGPVFRIQTVILKHAEAAKYAAVYLPDVIDRDNYPDCAFKTLEYLDNHVNLGDDNGGQWWTCVREQQKNDKSQSKRPRVFGDISGVMYYRIANPGFEIRINKGKNKFNVKRKSELEEISRIMSFAFLKRKNRPSKETPIDIQALADTLDETYIIGTTNVRSPIASCSVERAQAELAERLKQRNGLFKGQIESSEKHKCPWKLLVLSRAFLAYHISRSRPDNIDSADKRMQSFGRWLCSILNLPDPCALGLFDAGQLINSLLAESAPLQFGTNCAFEDYLDGIRAEIGSVNKNNRGPGRLNVLVNLLREHLVNNGSVITTHLDNSDLETIVGRVLMQFRLRLEAIRHTYLYTAMSDEHWDALVESTDIERILTDPQVDTDRWGDFTLDDHSVASPAVDMVPSPSKQWRTACMGIIACEFKEWLCPDCGSNATLHRDAKYQQIPFELVAPKSPGVECGHCSATTEWNKTIYQYAGHRDRAWFKCTKGNGRSRNTVDQAKSRLDKLKLFDLFTDDSNSTTNRQYATAYCAEIIQSFPALVSGDITTHEGDRLRTHLSECNDCFWKFGDYIQDRTAWGFTPQPQVAAIREKLRTGHELLRLWLNAIPTDLADIRDAIQDANDRVRTAVPAPMPISSISVDTSSQFNGFDVQVGETITAAILDQNGNDTGRKLNFTVNTVSCDEISRSAVMDLQSASQPETTDLVLIARLAYADTIFSLAGPISETGSATLEMADVPVELTPGVRVEAWFVAKAY